MKHTNAFTLLLFVPILLSCLPILGAQPGPGGYLGIVKDSVIFRRDPYPPVKPSEGPVRIYAGEWQMDVKVHNYADFNMHALVKIFVDGKFSWQDHATSGFEWGDPLALGKGATSTQFYNGSLPTFQFERGSHRIRIEVWHSNSDETQPQDTYEFEIKVVKAVISSSAKSKVVRGIGENTLTVSITNDGDDDMRQARLSIGDSKGLIITPSSTELGDVRCGESKQASFKVSAPASVLLGTVLPSFSLSFIDYAGISHTESIQAEVEVYRLPSSLTLQLPERITVGSTVEIKAILRAPNGTPLAGENISITVDGRTLGTFRTSADGVATAKYRPEQVGSVQVEASFGGSASYEASSDSQLLAVSEQGFPYWIPLLLLILVAVAIGAWWKHKHTTKRKESKEPTSSSS